MNIIGPNFDLEFARDLLILLETLEKEFGNSIINGNTFQKKKMLNRFSELTEGLYEKYKSVLMLFLKKFGNLMLFLKNWSF